MLRSVPARLPKYKTFSETRHYVRTIKEACLNRLIFVGEQSLRRAIAEFVAHYHRERNHQGLNNQLLCPEAPTLRRNGPIACRERLAC